MAFDAVGTLIFPEPSVSRVYWTAGQKFGSRQTLDQVRTGFQQVFQDLAPGARGDYSTSEVEEKARWRQIVEQVLHDVTDLDACFDRLHAHFGRTDAWRTFPDVAETLQQLADQGLKVVIASNFDERLHSVCDELPDLRPLQERVISATIGWHKPSPNFYSHLIEIAGCPAEEILMVGDDLENDVVAAQASGLQAVLINREAPHSEASISDLRQLVGSFVGH